MTKFKRKPKPKADAILSADWHIRPDAPICRTDDFFMAMAEKIISIFDLAEKNDCPIFIAGDLGNKPQWPNWLLEWFIFLCSLDHNPLQKGVEILLTPGQHDLPNHRLDLYKKSAVGVLSADNTIEILLGGQHEYLKDSKIHGFPYGLEISKTKREHKRHVAIAHQMVIENKILWPGQKAPKGHQLLKKFPEYDIILTGDNHNAFTVEYEGRWLINPGSMMRSTADQANHEPRVYLWWAENNKIEPVYLPIKQNVISREHIEIVEDRDNRMESYMTRVREDTEVALSYEDNLERYFNRYRTIKPVKKKVWENVG